MIMIIISSTIPVDITKQHDVTYRAQFTPREVGEHKITVNVGSSVVPGCPFTCKVGDSSKVIFKRKGTFTFHKISTFEWE